MQKLRVLLADDDDALRGTIKRVLEGRGMEVVGEAVNGADAVEMAKHISCDVVVTDLRMPVMDGIEAVRQITALASPPVVIVLSAYADPSLKEEARVAGAAGFLQKGTRARELCEQIFAFADQSVSSLPAP
jgi:DNA-binding NarL/FixJ family response regulator